MRYTISGALLMMAGIVVSTVRGFPSPVPGLVGEVEQHGASEGVLLSVHERSSHDGLYRSRAMPDLAGLRTDQSHVWEIEVRDARGSVVPDAVLSLESWMPETGWTAPEPPRAIATLEGRYRIDGLRFDRSGWWNVRLQITSELGTDSLAFNLIR